MPEKCSVLTTSTCGDCDRSVTIVSGMPVRMQSRDWSPVVLPKWRTATDGRGRPPVLAGVSGGRAARDDGNRGEPSVAAACRAGGLDPNPWLRATESHRTLALLG